MERSGNIRAWASGSTLRQATLFSSPSTDDESDQPPPGFERIHFENQWKSYGDDLPPIPVIKWKCPPSVALNGKWGVAAGESSKEKKLQERREAKVKEFVYRDVDPIPQDAVIYSSVEKEYYDDTLVLLVPLEAAEEEIEKEPAVTEEIVEKEEEIEKEPVTEEIVEEEEEIEEGEYRIANMHAEAKKVGSTAVETMNNAKYRKKNPNTKHDDTRKRDYSTISKYENDLQDSKRRRSERSKEPREEVRFRSRTPCRFFNSSKGCWNGHRCIFRHERHDHRRGASKHDVRDNKLLKS